MSDDYDEVDELEKDDDQEEEEEEVTEAATDAEDGEASPPAAERGGKAPPRDVGAEHSIAARQAARDEMERQVEEFLARGGKISQIEPNVTADPPRKPDGGDYRGRSI